jgi:hypothetical protein
MCRMLCLPLIVLGFLFAVSTVSVAAESKGIRSIAVLDLEGSGMDAGEVKTLSDALRNSIIDNNVYTVLERGKMDVILKEQGFQQSGACTNDACAVEMGQLLGVDAMILGSIGKVGKTYSMTVRILDLSTGRILRSASQFYKGEIDGLLTETIQGIAKKICVADKPAQTASKDAVDVKKETPAKPAETPAKTESVSGNSNMLLYIAIGAAALAGGIGIILFLNNSSKDETTTPPETTEPRPSYPAPPSAGFTPAMRGGN